MQKVVYLPQIELNLESAIVVRINVEEGEFVEVEQTLLEVETQKATLEVPSSESGYVRKILVAIEDEVGLNDALAILTDESNEPFDVGRQIDESAKDRGIETLPLKDSFIKPGPHRTNEALRAVPAARKLARELGVDLHQVRGSGPRGRINVKDIEAQVSRGTKAIPNRDSEWTPLTPAREALIDQMKKSLEQIPQIHISRKLDVKALVQAKEGPAFTARLVAAVGKALVEHPKLRTSIEGNRTRLEPVSVAIAMNSAHGLVAPVIRKTDELTKEEIGRCLKDFADRAEKNLLRREELTDGPFAVSNLGSYHVDHFIPFVFFGQTAVLAVGQAKSDGAKGNMIAWCTLGVDHRVVDGVDAARFLETLQREIG